MEHDNFMQDHDCPINHEGSAGSMESAGNLKMFQNSVENLNLRFIRFIGDAKAFPAVSNAFPHGPDPSVAF